VGEKSWDTVVRNDSRLRGGGCDKEAGDEDEEKEKKKITFYMRTVSQARHLFSDALTPLAAVSPTGS